MTSYPSEESKGDDEGIPFGKVKNLERGYDELLKEIYSSDAYKRERPGLHNATKKSAPSKQMGIPPQYRHKTLDELESGKLREFVLNKNPVVPTQFPPNIYGITAEGVDLEAGPGGKATRNRKSHKSKKARKSRKVRKSKKSRKTRK